MPATFPFLTYSPVYVTSTHILAFSSGYTFYPLSTESYGRLGAPAMQLLNKLADIADDTGPIEKDTFVTNALRELSIALCRGNALVYRSCASALNRLTGVAPTSGLLVPTSEIF